MLTQTPPGFLAQADPWHRSSFPSTHSPALAATWLKALGEENPSSLARRLAWEAAGPQPPGPAPRPPAAEARVWLAALGALRAALQDAVDLPLVEQPSPHHQLPFVDLWQPAADRALQALRSDLEPRLGFPVTLDAWRHLRASLLDRLCLVGAQTLWEVFNRERGPGVMLLAQLGAKGDGAGPPPRELYERFVRRHRGDGLGALLGEFPVLGRLLGTVVALWQEGSAELLLRLDGDRPLLARPDTWGIPAAAPLTSIQQGLSDPHRGGRAVAIVTFGEQEAATRLVYKPKDMRVDEAYQALLHDLNQHTALPPLRTVRILTRPGYGYMEYVPHRPCGEADELQRFYRNAGRLTAVLYLLSCTDCHHENLIASGDQLVLIDTETLLEGDIPNHVDAANGVGDEEVAAPAGLQREVAGSVLRSGMLPLWQFIGPHQLARDISALGIATPSKPTQLRAGWAALNTDGMMRAQQEVASELPTSLPVGIGRPNPLDEHLGFLLEGFRQQCEALIERRSAWLGAPGLLARFEGLPRRVVLRSTHVYFGLREQQLHPSALVSGEAQGMVLEKLARTFLLAKSRPRHWPVFAAEVRQMEQLDIPFFVHAIDGEALALLPGMEPIESYMQTSGLRACRTRLQELDADDIAFQCRLISGAVQARVGRVDPPTNRPPGRGAAPRPSSPGAAARLARAEKVARQLEDLAVLDNDGTPHWLGMDLGADGEKLCFGAVGMSLYGGSAGVALLQAALATSSGRTASRTPGILKPLAELAGREDDGALRRWWRSQPLGSAGSGGLLLTLLELDRLGAAPPEGWSSHRSLALRLLGGLTEARLEADTSFDVLGGGAGLIGPLLRLLDPRADALAIHAGRHLLRQQLGNGGWPRPNAADVRRLPLTGFSHGTAGIAAALARLHQRTQEEGLLVGAQRAVAYERACYDAGRGNWPDHRVSDHQPAFTATWCHGAPGIALARLALRGTALQDEATAGELEAALRTTSQTSPEVDHLCCGAMGLVAILRLAGQRLQQAEWQRAADRMEVEVLARADGSDGQFRMYGTREGGLLLPGLMTGLSGIGLALVHTPVADACVAQLISAGLLA